MDGWMDGWIDGWIDGWMETVPGPGPVCSLSLGRGQQIRSLHFPQAVGSLVWGSLNSKQLIGPQGRVDIEISPVAEDLVFGASVSTLPGTRPGLQAPKQLPPSGRE